MRRFHEGFLSRSSHFVCTDIPYLSETCLTAKVAVLQVSKPLKLVIVSQILLHLDCYVITHSMPLDK